MIDSFRSCITQLARLHFSPVGRSAIQKLGAEIFEKVYKFLREAKQQNTSEEEIKDYLEKVVCRASDCFEVDQLLYLEDQLCPSEDAGDRNRSQNEPAGIM